MTEPDKHWHPIQWDSTKVARFWDFSSHWEPWQDDYFSKQVGQGVINLLRYLLPLKGRILDLGCGPGYLSEKLLEAGAVCEAFDSSPESVRLVNQKFATHPLWGGARSSNSGQLPYEDNSFDLVISIETIEHILPEHMAQWLLEINRIIKPQTGRLFISTPNAENLERNVVYCPECSTVFHRHQHVSSFDKSSLASLLEQNKMETIMCENTIFHRFQTTILSKRIIHWNLVQMAKWCQWQALGIEDHFFPSQSLIGGRRFQSLMGKGHHLIWFGKKVA